MNTKNGIGLALVMALIWMSLAGCGSNSTNTTVPATPSGVTATAGNGQVVVNWKPVPNATSYRIYDGTVSGVTKNTAIGTIELHREPPYVIDSGNGTPHYLVMSAFNAAARVSYHQKSQQPQVQV